MLRREFNTGRNISMCAKATYQTKKFAALPGCYFSDIIIIMLYLSDGIENV